MIPPRASVRLQFHTGFTLDDAVLLVEYFAALGISHIYASPLTQARAGSTHGYDVTDPQTVSPELGGELALRRLVTRLREAGMGLILDIVPNHMATGAANAWWRDVLRWGARSRYAGHFDIDWQAADPALRGKVLAPFLGGAYGTELAAGRLRLVFDSDSGEFEIHHHDNRFPVTPQSYDTIFSALPPTAIVSGLIHTFATLAEGVDTPTRQLAGTTLREACDEPAVREAIQAALQAHDPGHAQGRERLHALLERQHYRLTWWRNAAEQINWRRFFEVSDLAGVRVEEPEVFDDVHALVIRLWAEGIIDGVRIDHVDGLTDPRHYCRKLRAALHATAASRPPGLQTEPWVLVEKILGEAEALPADWQVDGSSGYDFMAQVGALLHDARGEPALTRLWQDVSGDTRSPLELVHEARRMLITRHFAGEHENLTRALHAIARQSALTRDWSRAAIHRTLLELLVAFPVYRTYGGQHGRTSADQRMFAQAREIAARHLQADDCVLLGLIDDWLGGEPPSAQPPGPARNARLIAIRRFQQLTAPLAAKSLEDTVFFRHGRLLSRNEVGAEPDAFSLGVSEFHQLQVHRAESFPHAMLATATHDHKRGEDARARLAALSEIPQQWHTLARSWLSSRPDVPHVVDQYMLLQTLVATWPLTLSSEAANLDELRERVDAWQIKSLREAKLRSSWFAPDTDYEALCSSFLATRLAAPRWQAVLVDFVQLLAPLGALKSLSQVLLRTTLPGVPDLYQGTEFWDFSLTDPDNRRPVDFAARTAALGRQTPTELLAHWRDGRIKQAVLQKALQLRQRHAALFARGRHIPLTIEAAWADEVIAFLREDDDTRVLVIAPRLSSGILHAGTDPAQRWPQVPPDTWGDAAVRLPPSCASTHWQSVFDGTRLAPENGALRLARVLREFPVLLAYGSTDG